MEYFKNTSQMRMFEGVNLGQVEKDVNAFMLTTARIYSVKHTPIMESEEVLCYHYIMVNYEP